MHSDVFIRFKPLETGNTLMCDSKVEHISPTTPMCSTEETFLQDICEILNRQLWKFYKNSKNLQNLGKVIISLNMLVLYMKQRMG